MRICRTKDELRAARARMVGTVGLVPTMGYLHDGHLALVRRAREVCDGVIATIFVNPTQFGPGEDLESYPRDIDRDLALLEAEGVDLVFLPTPDEMYAPGAQTSVSVERLSEMLIGALRPGHFQGVATVVTKLLNLTRPDAAFFGQKDYQQLAVIRILVRDLDIPTRIEGVPTRREADGLAMSSRNVRLTPAARAAAPALHRALEAARAALETGAPVAETADDLRARLAAVEGAEIGSVDIRDAETLAPLEGALEAPAVVLLAVRFDSVLLIDNILAAPEAA